MEKQCKVKKDGKTGFLKDSLKNKAVNFLNIILSSTADIYLDVSIVFLVFLLLMFILNHLGII